MVSCYIKVKKQRNIKSWDQQNTVNGVNFAGLIFRVWQHKNICGLLNSHWADICSFDVSVLHKILDIIQWYISKQLGSTKTKQASHILQYITHLHQHTWSIHNYYVSKMCIQNIANIFAGFWIALAEYCAKFAKINAPRIFPLLQ